jgi:hypothetical protein
MKKTFAAGLGLMVAGLVTAAPSAYARGRQPEETTTTTTTTTDTTNTTTQPGNAGSSGNMGNVDGSRDTSVGTQNNNPAGIASSGTVTSPVAPRY